MFGLKLIANSLQIRNIPIKQFEGAYPRMAGIRDYQAIDTVFISNEAGDLVVTSEQVLTPDALEAMPSVTPTRTQKKVLVTVTPTLTLEQGDKPLDEVKINLEEKEQKEEIIPSRIPVVELRPTAPVVPLPSAIEPTMERVTQASSSDQLLDAVNAYRKERSKDSLITNGNLCKFARERSEEIVDDFSHNGFEQKVKDNSLDYLDYSSIAENIWQGKPFEIDRVIDGWDGSRAHKETMLDNWKYGCGAVKDNSAVFLFMNP
jgi:uncharacterized protein YkwD